MKLNNGTKALLILLCLSLAVIGFLVKLPSNFRQIDKELHSVFYFLAAAFINLLFANKNFIRHIVIFISLYLFGMAIEYAQEYSNKFFHKKIHGRYDHRRHPGQSQRISLILHFLDVAYHYFVCLSKI
jgi:hypothetical protein